MKIDENEEYEFIDLSYFVELNCRIWVNGDEI